MSPINFSLTPPIGNTIPLKVISPVMAISDGTGLSNNTDKTVMPW